MEFVSKRHAEIAVECDEAVHKMRVDLINLGAKLGRHDKELAIALQEVSYGPLKDIAHRLAKKVGP